ncbi:MAG: cobalamin B12-binding domain-containing protein, partial [Desulfuromonadales bacterium]|nr:cobalamin B12-binding domain-containing protein [Desulfuromonadales bacterium]
MSMQVDNNRILLVHPLGYAVSAAGKDISRIVNIMPPIGLASMAAYLEREDFTADIIDCYAHPDSDQKIRQYVQQHRPGWIGFSCTTSSFLDAVRLAQ